MAFSFIFLTISFTELFFKFVIIVALRINFNNIITSFKFIIKHAAVLAFITFLKFYVGSTLAFLTNIFISSQSDKINIKIKNKFKYINKK